MSSAICSDAHMASLPVHPNRAATGRSPRAEAHRRPTDVRGASGCVRPVALPRRDVPRSRADLSWKAKVRGQSVCAPPTRLARGARCQPRTSAFLSESLAAVLQTRHTIMQDLFPKLLTASPGLLPAAIANAGAAALAWPLMLRDLTVPGLAAAAVLGTLIMAAFGVNVFYILCLCYLFRSTMRNGFIQRGPEHALPRLGPLAVWASGLACGVCAGAALVMGDAWRGLLLTGAMAALTAKVEGSAARAGAAISSRFLYLPATFEPCQPGTPGAESVEGTVAGLLAGGHFAALAWISHQLSPQAAAIVAGASFFANMTARNLRSTGMADSHVLSTLQTWMAAITAMGLQMAVAGRPLLMV